MTASLSTAWPAPAKLNLFLHINHQRDDGYHELQTLFQFIDHSDYLDFKITQTPSLILHSSLNKVVPQNDNLILKAAKSLQAYTQCSQGAEIYLDKRLPLGGGIGGGSSNAATTLVALNSLWNTHLSQKELCHIGLKLGADIPIFINGLSSFAEGVGEQFTPVTPIEKWYLIITPTVHVSTADIFRDPKLPRDTPKLSLDALMSAPWHNDCQKLVTNRYPQVANALAWLLEYAPSRMTGTGACVFGEFEQHQQALSALAKLPAEMSGFVAQGKNISPLTLRLAQR
ncbi:4-(cytidine 5'-diphospho)-2-C-methyl-D-erythritol kinase [uncultured Shewanella sp.]|uniref:4-(cytidine 5'-diphospho)-2-C-methyl-D-erythritol kinase n=1 Tax=uncultured Shewanella sp. TaxID=173975 RepID=UPI002635CA36|nr:4-(cytidine 5'-diphospho)-2-C-methyl-D-erythritol kinase [uncultured Shewanella sp.]